MYRKQSSSNCSADIKHFYSSDIINKPLTSIFTHFSRITITCYAEETFSSPYNNFTQYCRVQPIKTHLSSTQQYITENGWTFITSNKAPIVSRKLFFNYSTAERAQREALTSHALVENFPKEENPAQTKKSSLLLTRTAHLHDVYIQCNLIFPFKATLSQFQRRKEKFSLLVFHPPSTPLLGYTHFFSVPFSVESGRGRMTRATSSHKLLERAHFLQRLYSTLH